jgi:hypothetical protein
LPDDRSIDLDLHRYFSQMYLSPNATPNHRGIEQIVTNRALTLERIMTQLTQEAKTMNAIAPAIMDRDS